MIGLRGASILSLSVVLSGCVQGATRQALDDEAGAVLAGAQPIWSPLQVTYAAGPPQRMQVEMRMQVGSQTGGATLVGTQQFARRAEALTYNMAIERMTTPQQTLECGSQPVLVVQASLAADGRLGRYQVAQTPGCSASTYMAANVDASMQQMAGLWLLPVSGIQTGTVLHRDVGTDPNRREGDSRGVVAGRALWRGRLTVVIRLEGCAAFRVNEGSTWIPLCLKGVSFLDPSTGLTIGALGNGDAIVPGETATAALRVLPL